ncbi:MAG: HNH endonuclease [Bifidobacteriaceae bacterium]|jgi:hypothetical protein|nr:HNH endonuclease [Bifidobacteriaceae bacterium]
MESSAARIAEPGGGAASGCARRLAVYRQLHLLLDELMDAPAPNSPQERLDCLRVLNAAQTRLEALYHKELRQADLEGTPQALGYDGLDHALAHTQLIAPRQTRGALMKARQLEEAPLVLEAALAGEINADQAHAVARALKTAEPHLSEAEFAQAQAIAVDTAKTSASTHVGRLTNALVAQVAPEAITPEDLRQRAAERAERAHSLRYLSFKSDGAGGLEFRGMLPEATGRRLQNAVEGFARRLHDQLKSAADQPFGPRGHGGRDNCDWGKLRVDALVEMTIAACGKNGQDSGLPGAVSTHLDVVIDATGPGAGEAVARFADDPDGEPIWVRDLQMLCCGADAHSMVVSGAGRRLLAAGSQTPNLPRRIRRAVKLRDAGCAFHGCDVPASMCDIHHVKPRRLGGQNQVGTLVLLCRRHHRLVEPDQIWRPDGGQVVIDPERWEIRFTQDGIPVTIPPVSVDPTRWPLVHDRHRAAVTNGKAYGATPSDGVPTVNMTAPELCADLLRHQGGSDPPNGHQIDQGPPGDLVSAEGLI